MYKKRLTNKLALVLSISITLLSALSFSMSAKAAVNAQDIFNDPSTNNLWKVGKYCYDMDTVNSRCAYYEGKFRNELNCGGLFFTSKNGKWNVKPGAYADCKQRVAVKINAIKEKCNPVNSSDSQWETCQDVYQGPLHAVLGCDSELFQDDGTRNIWKPKPEALSKCTDRLKAVETLKLLDPDGKQRSKTVAEETPESPDSASDPSEVDCEGGGALGWIICPVSELGQNIANDVFTSVIEPMLEKVPVSTSSTDGAFKAWQGFRTIANIILVGALLVIVYAQATGGVLDAYSVRKLAPRIVIGVILINLSIYLCVALIDITNVASNGLAKLLTAPFDMTKVGLDTGSSTVAGLLGVILTAIGGLYAVIFVGASFFGIVGLLILTAVILAFAIMFTLVIRQTLLVLLTIISPVAIALWLLPSTEQYFKKWWDLFIKTLMVYPIIAALFSISGIMATIAFTGPSAGSSGIGNLAGGFNIVTAVILCFAPLFLIPFAFKFAGGVVGAVMGMANKPLAGLSKMRGQMHRNAVGKNWQNIKDGNRWAGGTDASGGHRGNFRGRMNRRLQTGALVGTGKAGFNPSQMGARLGSHRDTASFARAMKAKENPVTSPVLSNDTLMHAAMHGNMDEASARRYLQGAGQSGTELEGNLAAIREARREVGARELSIAAATSLPGTKTAYQGSSGAGEMLSDAVRVAGGNSALEGMIMNQQRTSAKASGRGDLANAGFGEGLKGMGAIGNAHLSDLRQAHASGDSEAIANAEAAASQAYIDDALTHSSAYEIMSGHSNSIANFMEAANTRVDSTYMRVQSARQRVTRGVGTEDERNQHLADLATAEREHKQALALSAGLLEASGQVGNASAQQAADSHQNHRIVGGRRISEAVAELRSDPEFQQMRREYSSERELPAGREGTPPGSPPPPPA